MPVVDIVHHTDPACSWCWGMEPILRRLQVIYGHQVRVTRKMGGVIPSREWMVGDGYMDRQARQIARRWVEVSKKVGMPIDPAMWLHDPPESTWPANIAYKAAQIQDGALADRYLRRVREAALLEGRNVGQYPVLLDLAAEMGLSVGAMERDIEGGQAKEAFFADVREGHRGGVYAFPTVFIRLGEREEKLEGWRPFREYLAAVKRVSGGALQRLPPPDLIAFFSEHGRATTQEVATIFQRPLSTIRRRLAALEAEGVLERHRKRRATIWVATPQARQEP